MRLPRVGFGEYPYHRSHRGTDTAGATLRNKVHVNYLVFSSNVLASVPWLRSWSLVLVLVLVACVHVLSCGTRMIDGFVRNMNNGSESSAVV
ncbi:hypothetical protein E2C01_036738 [Portunus trituberculatus]|uniref:Transmembrane protein n=1 Tax=Portunus trituberculatus TaxID=210409 RepID=A0A5B7F7H8_PORTR|nr:hypothetical protein [Portunus trituberculatus]